MSHCNSATAPLSTLRRGFVFHFCHKEMTRISIVSSFGYLVIGTDNIVLCRIIIQIINGGDEIEVGQGDCQDCWDSSRCSNPCHVQG
uniref:Uncharacterized protein n=1 Tax=Salix viminalis TaxID=40686 RepID=A0A6N2MYS5_SALVM